MKVGSSLPPGCFQPGIDSHRNFIVRTDILALFPKDLIFGLWEILFSEDDQPRFGTGKLMNVGEKVPGT